MENSNSIIKYSNKKREDFRLETRRKSLLLKFNEKRLKILENKENTNSNDQIIINSINEIFDNSPKNLIVKNILDLIENTIKQKNNKNKLFLYSVQKLKEFYLGFITDKEKKAFINDFYIHNGDSILENFLNKDFDVFPELQFETLWVFGNIFVFYNENHINFQKKLFVNLLRFLQNYQDLELIEIVLICLGNSVLDNEEIKNGLIQANIDDYIFNFYNQYKHEKKHIYNVVWMLSNIFRNKPYPDKSYLKKFIPMLNDILTIHESDEDMLQGCLTCFRAITFEEENQKLCINQTKLFIKSISHNNNAISYFALTIIGNLTNGDENQVNTLLQNGLLDHLEYILKNSKIKSLRKITAWIISNLFAEGEIILEKIFKHKIFDLLIKVISELIIGLANSTIFANKNQFDILLKNNILETFEFGLLQYQNNILIDSVLDGLINILKRFPERDIVNILKKMEELGISNSLEFLQNIADQRIYKKVLYIIENYFEYE